MDLANVPEQIPPEAMNHALAVVWNERPEYAGHVDGMLQVARVLRWNSEKMDIREFSEAMSIIARYAGPPELPIPGPLPRPPAGVEHERNLAAVGLVAGANNLPDPNRVRELGEVYAELRRENPLDFRAVMWLAGQMDERSAFLAVFPELTLRWYVRALFMVAKHAGFMREGREQALLAHFVPDARFRM